MYTLNKCHVQVSIGFPFEHFKLPISIKIPVTTWQIVYIYMTAISPIYGSFMVVITDHMQMDKIQHVVDRYNEDIKHSRCKSDFKPFLYIAINFFHGSKQI